MKPFGSNRAFPSLFFARYRSENMLDGSTSTCGTLPNSSSRRPSTASMPLHNGRHRVLYIFVVVFTGWRIVTMASNFGTHVDSILNISDIMSLYLG